MDGVIVEQELLVHLETVHWPHALVQKRRSFLDGLGVEIVDVEEVVLAVEQHWDREHFAFDLGFPPKLHIGFQGITTSDERQTVQISQSLTPLNSISGLHESHLLVGCFPQRSSGHLVSLLHLVLRPIRLLRDVGG